MQLFYPPFNALFIQDSALADTKTRVEELKMENEYQMRLKDMNYKDKTRELKETLSHEIETLRRKNEVCTPDWLEHTHM